MKNLNYTLYILLVIVFSSCNVVSEREYNRRSWEIKKKTIELEYLEKLYKVRSDIEYKEKMKTIDSLIENCCQ